MITQVYLYLHSYRTKKKGNSNNITRYIAPGSVFQRILLSSPDLSEIIDFSM